MREAQTNLRAARKNVSGSSQSCHGSQSKQNGGDKVIKRRGAMGPKKQAKPSRWQPLPDNAPTMQSTSVYGFDDHTVKLEDLSKEDIENSAKFIDQSNKTIEVENTIIEMYLLRMDPGALLKIDQVLEAMQKMEKAQTGAGGSSLSINAKNEDGSEYPSHRSSMISKSFSLNTMTGNKLALLMMADKGPKVQVAHKIEIVNREIEELRNALEEFRQHAKHSNYILRCRNEELSGRLREIKDSWEYFEDKLLVEGTDPLTGKLPGEKFIRYLEVKLLAEESQIDKMRMKTSSTRNQLKRVEQQLTQKAELGEILHAIDFEQLKIENRDCQERLDEKILHLIEIKKINGRCGTILNFNLKKLQEQVSLLSNLKKSIEMKQKMIDQLRLDEIKVNEEVNAASKSVAKIKQLMNSYRVPDVFDYILEKAEMLDIKKEIKICERKLKLKDLALASQASKLRAKMDPSLNLFRARSSKKFSHVQ